jgi:hypothetical protein
VELRVFWRTLRRRWYLTLVVVALTIGATTYVVRTVGPTYEAEGSALVFPPTSSAKLEGEAVTVGNPYLELAGVNQARDVVIRTLKSRTVQTEWGEKYPGMSYEATPDFTNSAPIILFTVEGSDSATTAAALDDLMGRVPQILDDLQGGLGLPQADLVTARKLTQDSRPAVVRKSQIRAALMATAAAGGIGLLLLALVDSLLVLRARGRAERRAAQEAEAARRAEEEAASAPPEPVDEDQHEDEDEDEDEPIYTYRVPLDSDLAISPARSKWLHTARSSAATRDGHRFREAPPTKPRSRASGRNR